LKEKILHKRTKRKQKGAAGGRGDVGIEKHENPFADRNERATWTLPLPGGRRCAGGAPVTGECEDGGLKKAPRGGFRGRMECVVLLGFHKCLLLEIIFRE
jgi:hypothetical protein